MTVRLVGMAAANTDIERKLNQLVRAVVLDADKRLIERTPKDTGRAQGNWQVDTKPVDPGADVGIRSQEDALADAASKLEGIEIGDDIIYITNGLPYIKPLEDGHSAQAASGMVKVTAAEVEQVVEVAARSLR